MSASREKKTRQERGAEQLSPKEQKAREERQANRRTTAIFTACAVLFIIAVAAMALYQSGVLQRGAAAASVNGQTYTAADIAYYYYNGRQNLLQSGSVDSGKSLREQTVGETDQTWYDYLADTAVHSLAEAAIVSQAAKDAGFDGGEELEKNISDTLDSLKSGAASNGYTLSQYLKAIYGPLMTKDVFERNLRMVTRAQEYSASVADVANYSEEELTAKRDAEPQNYDVVSVRHILVDSEDSAKDILAQWEAGDKTEDSFAALATENTTDSGSKDNGGLYTDVLQGQMATEFNDWCFDDSRKAGDTGIVQTSYGYHVMYFVSRGLYSDWQTRAASAIASEKVGALSEDADTQLLDGMKYIDN